MSMRKIVWTLLGVLVGSVIPLLPLEGLEWSAKVALGLLAGAILWWIGQTLPDYVTALLLALLLVVLTGVPTETVFSAFSGSSWWLLTAAFGLSLGVTKCGLMDRIASWILRIFPATFRGQVLGLLAVGTITAPLIPSLSGKAAILAPLSLGVSDSMGYLRKSREANGLFLAMFTGLRTPALLFVSASVLGYTLPGLYPEEIQRMFSPVRWFWEMLPWFLMVTAANAAVLLWRFHPCGVSEQTRKEKQKPGPMSRQEKYMLGLILATMVLWVAQPLHHVPAHIIALGALCLTLAGGVYDRTAFRGENHWDSILYLGVVLGLAPTFQALGINQWLVDRCGPLMERLATNPYALVVGVAVVTVLLRFVIVSELAYANLFLVFMVPLAVNAGINPWVVGMAVYAMVNPWFFQYQNPVYMAACQGTGEQMAEPKVAAKYCVIYLAICLVALLLSVPWWMKTGAFWL